MLRAISRHMYAMKSININSSKHSSNPKLIEKISPMPLEEQNLERYFDSRESYFVFTPIDQEKGASQLDQFIKQRT